MNHKKNERWALITGASSGIGKSFAEVLGGHGFDLVLIARREERLQEVARTLEGKHGIRTLVLRDRLGHVQYPDIVLAIDRDGRHLAEHPVDQWTIGATFGVAARPPHATETADVVRCANEALARGKREGGGRVAIYVEEKMVLKSNYYSRASLDRLSKLAGRLNRTEASLLREALDDLFQKLR